MEVAYWLVEGKRDYLENSEIFAPSVSSLEE